MKNRTIKTEKVNFTVYGIPPEAYNKIVRNADKEGRSINQQLIRTIIEAEEV